MSEAEYITPTTWEECARHVEAGGIVEVKVGEWHAQHSPPSAYRSLIGSPPPSLPRRLVPIEPVGGYEATIVELDEASDWMGPAMTTTSWCCRPGRWTIAPRSGVVALGRWGGSAWPAVRRWPVASPLLSGCRGGRLSGEGWLGVRSRYWRSAWTTRGLGLRLTCPGTHTGCIRGLIRREWWRWNCDHWDDLGRLPPPGHLHPSDLVDAWMSGLGDRQPRHRVTCSWRQGGGAYR